jgi:hypothetical protein
MEGNKVFIEIICFDATKFFLELTNSPNLWHSAVE